MRHTWRAKQMLDRDDLLNLGLMGSEPALADDLCAPRKRTAR
jgi:hypothetical protein